MLRRPVLAILSLYWLQSKSALGNYLFQHCCDISHKSSCVQASKKISREVRLKVSRRICLTHESNRVLGSMRLTEPRVHDRHGLYQLFGANEAWRCSWKVKLHLHAPPSQIKAASPPILICLNLKTRATFAWGTVQLCPRQMRLWPSAGAVPKPWLCQAGPRACSRANLAVCLMSIIQPVMTS